MRTKPISPRRVLQLGGAAVLALGQVQVQAGTIETGIPDLELSFNNTVKYSAARRLKDPSPLLISNRNQDDGNRNFDKGLIQSRFDLFSEFDLAYKRVGLRVSGAAWYDSRYLRPNAHPGPTSNRPIGTAPNTFSREVRELFGKDAELLDAFVYGSFDVGGKGVTVRAGRHGLVWGESLFYAANSIAAGMNPTDVIKARSVPGTTTKELIRPTGKVSLEMALTDSLSLAAYVPYEWERSRIPLAGSYFSAGETMSPPGERIFLGPVTYTALPDQETKDGGQGGLSLRWRADAIDTDLGFHVIRYHANGPANFYSQTGSNVVQWVGHEGVRAYAISAAKTIGTVSWGAEVSLRDNTPLASDARSLVPGQSTAFGPGNPGFAVGRSAHAQLNWIASLAPSWLADEASLTGELAWNRRLGFDYGEVYSAKLAQRDAASLRVQYSPTYRQVLPGLDLSVPLNVSYTAGRSSAIGPGFGVDNGGDASLTVIGTYLNNWVVSLNYTHFYGTEDTNTKPVNGSATFTYAQAFKDRNFVSMSIRTTF